MPGTRRSRLVPSRVATIGALCGLVVGLLLASPAASQSLRGSWASMDRQIKGAQRHNFTYLDDREDVDRFVRMGILLPVEENENLRLKDVSFPVARIEVRDFLQELASGYKQECDDQLVVTSLTRPRKHQPPNAARRSVHPTGMAFDLHRPWNRACRSWLEGMLVYLEYEGVLEATMERNPYHYHVALFPREYRQTVARGRLWPESRMYRVNPGDTLSSIARRYKTTVSRVKEVNGIRSNMIYVGQLLRLE
jgi:hypothetical protein